MRLTYIIPLLLFVLMAVLLVYRLSYVGLPDDGDDNNSFNDKLNYSLTSLFEPEKSIKAADFKGKKYILNFFASWCVPCRAEHKSWLKLKGENEDILLVGVAWKDNANNAKAFLDELKNPYDKIGLDKDGRFGIFMGIRGIPETFVIGENQKVVFYHQGPITPSTYKEILEIVSPEE